MKRSRTVEPIKYKKDVDKLGSYFLNTNLRNYALFYFMMNTGRRIGDTLSLNIEDVAYIDKAGKIQILPRFEVKEQKTLKLASVVINEEAEKALRKYLLPRFRASQCSLSEFMKQALFSSRKRRPNGERRLSRSSAWRILVTAITDIGLDVHIGTHSLRKTCGYRLYKNGAKIELIQAFLNHESSQTTLAYIGINQESIDRELMAICK